MSLSDNELILIIVLPIFGVFFLALFAYIIYYCRCCSKAKRKNRLSEDTELLVSHLSANYGGGNVGTRREVEEETTFVSKSDMNLIEKVKIEKLKQLAESRETAYFFLQFFIRSNPERVFKSIDHLQAIGCNSYRNWFLVKETTKNASRLKMFLIDVFSSNKRLLQICESMTLSRRQMELLIRDYSVKIKHPNVLGCEVHLNFDKGRVLFIQDYSRDGSLRDSMRDTQPDDEWTLKLEKNRSKNAFNIMTVKNFAKQILSGLVYLKFKQFPPLVNLHSGNIILAYNKRLCLLTGYESCFLTDGKISISGDKLKKIQKTYFIRTAQHEIKKAQSDNEIKQAVEILQFGNVLIEMCTGIDGSDDLVPSEDVLKLIERYQQVNKQNNQLLEFMQFIFRNKTGLGDEYKQKKKYVLPSLDELISHSFFEQVKFKDDDSTYTKELLDPDHYELMQYINGSLKPKEKKRRKSSVMIKNDSFSSFNKNTNLSPQTATFTQKVTAKSVESIPPPPPPPPPPSLIPLKTAPSPPPQTNISEGNKTERQALLGDIRKGLNLKKTVTNDRSKPKVF